jgi:FAD/FMN-containing dehydrogenase/Fe-S oxidoreductase
MDARTGSPDASLSMHAARELAAELRANLKGEVRFDPGSQALYATDASNYRQVPIGVVLPKTIDDLVNGVAACRRHDVPVLARGGGTSLCGQCCNAAVVFDCSKYLNRIESLDVRAKCAWVQPGLVLDDLRNSAEKHHLTFAPDPSTHSHNTLGGMIGNNSCGVHSVMGGKTSDNVLELEVLTYEGQRLTVGATSESELAAITAENTPRGRLYLQLMKLRDEYAELIRERFPRIPRRVSGYNLEELLPERGFHVARSLVGSEGTCVIVLRARVRLVDSPPGRSLLVLGYPDVYAAGDHVPEVLKFNPIGLEGIDERLIEDMKAINLHPRDVTLLPPGNGWLLIEFGGADRGDSHEQARACMRKLQRRPDAPSMKLFDDPKEEALIWEVRKSGLGATAHVPNKPITWEGWEDSAVPPERLGQYLRDLRALFERYHYACDLYGHFGQGCVHTRIDFDLETAAGIATFRRFLDDAADLVVSHGGSISGEHGDGQSKAVLLPRMFGPQLVQAFGRFKALWDPRGRMNPGKIVDAYRPDENLRLGTGYHPPQLATHFRFPRDADNFGRVALRCVGVGECRRKNGKTMCPSYRATGEEAHSTRGRARLLFEMLRGEVLREGWRDPHVKAALDLCLACKGCLGDCPVNVDMATYKAEFLSHYYKGRLRPRTAYAFGYLDRWMRLATHAPWLANGAANAKGLGRLLRSLAHIAPERSIPSVAAESFQRWFRRRPTRPSDGGPKVLLWPDTFNNYFHPQVARAAVQVLEAAGLQVTVPEGAFCCGRPLYDFGFLDRARHYLEHILAALRGSIDAGIPFVVLEPACAATFRHELPLLLPGDEGAKRLASQTFFFSEFLTKRNLEPAISFPRHVLVHGHCHQKALIKMECDEKLFASFRAHADILDGGCCGMAGSFGFEADKYALSQSIGELAVLPAMRAAAEDTLLVADGFSCREQIRQACGRDPLHTAELLARIASGN